MLLAGNRVQKVCERLHILSPELIDAMGIAHIYVCMARCDRRSFFKSFDVSSVGKLLSNCNVPILVSLTTMFASSDLSWAEAPVPNTRTSAMPARAISRFMRFIVSFFIVLSFFDVSFCYQKDTVL
jgi:hypothetical protein